MSCPALNVDAVAQATSGDPRTDFFYGSEEDGPGRGVLTSATKINEKLKLLRDIFSNPFRPVTFDPAWRTDHTVGIATKMYAERSFDAMPILADALEEAGCDNADIQEGLAKACFAAGTKLWTPAGYRSGEAILVGEVVYSRDEWDPRGAVEVKVVEEVFERFAGVYHLHLGGQLIRTTGEHPFCAAGKGWTAAQELQPGDGVLTADGTWVRVNDRAQPRGASASACAVALHVPRCLARRVGCSVWFTFLRPVAAPAGRELRDSVSAVRRAIP
jgi:hypothetical protein